MRKRTTGLLLGTITALALGIAIAPTFAGEPTTKSDPAKAPETKKDPYTSTAAAAKIGAPAPQWTGTDLNGKPVKLSDFKGKTVVLEWFNPECPFVVKAYGNKISNSTFAKYKDKNVAWVLINSGAPGKEGASPEVNKTKAGEWGITCPIVTDSVGAIGKMYGAKTTPHMFIINKDGVLAYAGAIDNNNAGDKFGKPEYVNYVDQALKQILAGETVTQPETKAYGCSVKYGV